jgi:hypothetical protein
MKNMRSRSCGGVSLSFSHGNNMKVGLVITIFAYKSNL